MHKSNNIGFLFALMAVSIWSGNFIIASGIVDSIPPVTLAALRWTVAAIVFFPFAYKHIRRDWTALRRHAPSMLLASITGVTCFNTLVYVSARTTDTANMALFASTTPLFVVILARLFLNERISLKRGCGLAIAFCGMLTIATRGDIDVLMNLTFRVGDLWMLLAGFLWAVYSVLVKRKPVDISQYSFLGVAFVIGVIPLIPAAMFEQQFYPAWTLTPAVLGAVAYIGLGASLAAFFLWNSAVMLIGPGTASLFQYLMPVFSGVGAYMLLSQPITIAHAIGFVLIVSGIFLATRTG